jgi:hypothetical protein
MGEDKVDPFQVQLEKRSAGASLVEIDKFEAATRERIPPDYRKFLTCQNGGAPVERNFEFGTGPYQDSVLREFFSLKGLKHALTVYRGRIPDSAFPIAADQFDNLIVISRARGSKNQVLFWDHEQELHNGPLSPVAKNLASFLKMLEPDTLVTHDIATMTYADGTTVRRVLPFRVVSLDRNKKVVGLEELSIGERFDDFGEIRTVAHIVFSKEQWPG